MHEPHIARESSMPWNWCPISPSPKTTRHLQDMEKMLRMVLRGDEARGR